MSDNSQRCRELIARDTITDKTIRTEEEVRNRDTQFCLYSESGYRNGDHWWLTLNNSWVCIGDNSDKGENGRVNLKKVGHWMLSYKSVGNDVLLG